MSIYQARRSKTALLVVLAGFVTLSTTGQQRHEFSVKQAVDYALKNSTQVKNALTDIKIQLQTNREITAAAYPQLSGSVSLIDYLKIPTSLIPGEVFGGAPGSYIPVQFGTKWNGTYGLNAEQIIFNGEVFVGPQARAASIEYANNNVAITEELIKANVYKIYYQLVVGKSQVGIFDANISRTEKLLGDTRALFENGFRERLDVDKIVVNLSNLRTEKTKVQNRLQIGYVGLKYLMGMPVKEDLILTDSLSEAMVKEQLLYDSVRYEDRKEYQLLQTLEKLNQFNVKRYQKTYFPTVSLTGGYNRNAQRNKFDFFKGNEPWFATASIGLQINVPIFDGFAKDARIKRARFELEKTRNNKLDLANKINYEMDSSIISMRNALVSLEEQGKNRTLAEQVYNQTKIKYDNGLGSNLEITNAEADLRIAQNNYFSALYDAIVARIDYLKALGKL